ncbi:MAG: endolytic transglycosylase MltG [Anaerolineae bacterium]|nr:endolytic transglycosylase MltG [Anaerolineae bacterium]
MSRRRKQNTCLEISLILILSLACLVVLAGGAGFFVIPSMAATTFGPPAENLSTVQRITSAAELLLTRPALTNAADPTGSPKQFTVQPGETANSVAARLEEAGVILSGSAFRTYLVYTGMDTSIQAGTYTFDPAMTAVEVARELQDATPEEVDFNILAGWRMEEIAATLPTSGLSIDPDAFLRTVASPPGRILPPGWEPGESLEGFLKPGSYRFMRTASAEEIITAMVEAFDQSVDADLRQAIAEQGLSLREAVILASIVEREAVVDEEKPLIASVFHNRLAQGMKLDSDPTVQYAIGYNLNQSTWWTNPLSLDDLQTNSPYNTYQNPGLPPGPICNPSDTALRAVAYPAQTPYFYFRAACDGSGRHSFARTFEEHLQNACP